MKRQLERFLGHTDAYAFHEPMFVVYARELANLEDDYDALLAVSRAADGMMQSDFYSIQSGDYEDVLRDALAALPERLK